MILIPFDLDGRGLVYFLRVRQQHQRHLLSMGANLCISVVIKMTYYEKKNHKNRFKKSQVYKKYLLYVILVRIANRKLMNS